MLSCPSKDDQGIKYLTKSKIHFHKQSMNNKQYGPFIKSHIKHRLFLPKAVTFSNTSWSF